MSAREKFLRRWYQAIKELDPHRCEAWEEEDGSWGHDPYEFDDFAGSLMASAGWKTAESLVLELQNIREELKNYVNMPPRETSIGGIRNLAQAVVTAREMLAELKASPAISTASAELYELTRYSRREVLTAEEIENIIRRHLDNRHAT